MHDQCHNTQHNHQRNATSEPRGPSSSHMVEATTRTAAHATVEPLRRGHRLCFAACLSARWCRAERFPSTHFWPSEKNVLHLCVAQGPGSPNIGVLVELGWPNGPRHPTTSGPFQLLSSNLHHEYQEHGPFTHFNMCDPLGAHLCLTMTFSFLCLSGGLLVEFWWCFGRPGPSNVHVWALGLSCEAPANSLPRTCGPGLSARDHVFPPSRHQHNTLLDVGPTSAVN